MHRRYWQRGSTLTDGAAYGLPGASAGYVGRLQLLAVGTKRYSVEPPRDGIRRALRTNRYHSRFRERSKDARRAIQA
jgi:hypothetical protein